MPGQKRKNFFQHAFSKRCLNHTVDDPVAAIAGRRLGLATYTESG